MHRHLDDLLFDLRRLPGIAVVQQKRAPLSLTALSATIAWFALTGRPVSDNISTLAVGTVQDLDNYDGTRLAWGLLGRSHAQRA
jgi:hypothetical protein